MSSKMAEARLSGDEEGCPPAKKIALEIENSRENDNSIHDAEVNLSTFQITKVLDNNYTRKRICVQGTFKGHDSQAIVLLEKKSFPPEELFLKRGFFNEGTILRKSYKNDIYGNYECFPTREYNGLDATVIHPATAGHIVKFQRKELYMVEETYELYKKIVLPFIESSSFSINWVYNILDHKEEEENIVYEDRDKESGFVLITDLKWDRQPGSLQLLALPMKKILCIRELNESHLPLLKNIRDKGTAAIAEKFNLPASRLRIYLHYQPSYYYLHVHFVYLMYEAPGIFVEKAHLLSSVIRNIELMPDYYTKAVLSYVVAEGTPLFNKYQEHGIVGEKKSESTDV